MHDEIKKKVLFFIPPDVGGAERVSLTVAKMLPTDRFEAKVIIVGSKTGDIVNFIPARIPYDFIHIRNIWDFTAIRLWRVIFREKPDCVFCSLNYLWPHLLWAAHWADSEIRIVLRCNIGFENWPKGFIPISVKHTLKWASRIIMQTDEMLQGMAAAFPEASSKMLVIDNPVDVESIETNLSADNENPFAKDSLNIVSTCRIHPCKRIDDLILAFADISKLRSNARLYVLGKTDAAPEYFAELQKMVKSTGLEGRVFFPGLQSNPYKYIKHADCYVLPSEAEGYPNSLLEALYLRVPSVSTLSVPVVKRILTSERGFIVEVGDVKGLSDAILKALDLKYIPEYIASNTEAFVELFN